MAVSDGGWKVSVSTGSAVCNLKFSFTPSGIQHFVIFAAQPYGLPLKEVTVAQYLKTLGYKTHAIGKVSSTGPNTNKPCLASNDPFRL